VRELSQRLAKPEGLTLLRSDKSMTDCRPVSVFSVQTARQLGDELGTDMDKRRFRANIFADLAPAAGFAENDFVGRTLRIGRRVVISILERDSRCAMITIDPDTAERNPTILSHVVKTRNGEAGVYGAVLVEGVIRVGDPIESSD
jgi:MOSC domain-containing protein